MKEGKPIWVESLMTLSEWKARYKMLSTSIEPLPPEEFDCDFKWRKGMGQPLSLIEMKRIEAFIDLLYRLKEQTTIN